MSTRTSSTVTKSTRRTKPRAADGIAALRHVLHLPELLDEFGKPQAYISLDTYEAHREEWEPSRHQMLRLVVPRVDAQGQPLRQWEALCALAAEGAKPTRVRRFTENERRSAILRCARLARRLPLTMPEYEALRLPVDEPSATTLRHHYGSWTDALDAAGVDS